MRRAAASSAVLLRNERFPGSVWQRTLPLSLSAPTKIAVIGRMATAESVRYQGAGSSAVNAHKLEDPLSALTEHVITRAPGCEVTFSGGYGELCEDDAAAIEHAVLVAKKADTAILFVGLPSIYEVEGRDRPHMRMPEQMSALVSAVAAANPRTVVVLLGGAPMELPFCDEVAAILWMGLAGQAIGGAIADVLFGVVPPGGRLAETWPMQLDDCPSQRNFGRNASIRQVVYREALNVGYRYFSSAKVPVRFPFGHGLTYTSFQYSDAQLARSTIGAAESASVTLKLTNVGGVPAAEVVQLYVRDCTSSVPRPDRELKAFEKVLLAPGATKVLVLELEPRAFAFYDLETKVALHPVTSNDLRTTATAATGLGRGHAPPPGYGVAGMRHHQDTA